MPLTLEIICVQLLDGIRELAGYPEDVGADLGVARVAAPRVLKRLSLRRQSVKKLRRGFCRRREHLSRTTTHTTTQLPCTDIISVQLEKRRASILGNSRACTPLTRSTRVCAPAGRADGMQHRLLLLLAKAIDVASSSLECPAVPDAFEPPHGTLEIAQRDLVLQDLIHPRINDGNTTGFILSALSMPISLFGLR